MKLYSILPEALNEFNKKKSQALAGLDIGMFVNQRQPMSIDEYGVATISVYGPLMRDAAPIDKMLGATDYNDIEDEIEAAIALGAKAIVFAIDSPGGTVDGLQEASEMIQGLSVPTVAYIEGLGTSAAYHLASSTTLIVGAKGSTSGNIGAVMSFVDASKFYENLGIEFNVFTNEGADMKSIGYNPSLSDEQKAFLQESINDTGKAFQDYVKGNRPEISEEVFNAAWYSADKALSYGVIDDIGNKKKALEYAMSF